MLFSEEAPPISWDIQYSNPPAVLRYCKKCGKKSEYSAFSTIQDLKKCKLSTSEIIITIS